MHALTSVCTFCLQNETTASSIFSPSLISRFKASPSSSVTGIDVTVSIAMGEAGEAGKREAGKPGTPGSREAGKPGSRAAWEAWEAWEAQPGQPGRGSPGSPGKSGNQGKPWKPRKPLVAPEALLARIWDARDRQMYAEGAFN